MSKWHAVAIDGPESGVRGLVAGVADDRGAAADIVFATDIGVRPDSLGERLCELVGAGRHVLVLVRETLLDALLASLAGEGAVAGLALGEHHRVRGAHFDFRVETYAQDVAKAVHEVLESLPRDAIVADRNESAEGRPEHKGVDLYAPVHDYVYRASGRVTGGFDGVRATRARFAAIEAVVVEALDLETA